LSLLPPSDARPACISTVIASATCLNFPIGVPQFSSNSLSIAIALAHLPEHLILCLTTNAAAAHTVAAQTTASPTATFPITVVVTTKTTTTTIATTTVPKTVGFGVEGNESAIYNIKGFIDKDL
jgi:hypothetical protein